MIEMNALFNNPTFDNWALANNIILKNLPPHIKAVWEEGGYEGMAPLAIEYFGMTNMDRPGDAHVRYTFTEEQWTMFLLKWAGK